MRLTLVCMYVRAYRRVPPVRPLARRYALVFLLGALVWLVSAFVPPPARYALWALAVLVDISRVFLPSLQTLVRTLPPDREHAADRYAQSR